MSTIPAYRFFVFEKTRRPGVKVRAFCGNNNLDDEALEQKIYLPTRRIMPVEERGELDMAKVHEELKRKNMTLIVTLAILILFVY